VSKKEEKQCQGVETWGIERLRLPKANRKEAFAALECASAVLENSAKNDESKETGTFAK